MCALRSPLVQYEPSRQPELNRINRGTCSATYGFVDECIDDEHVLCPVCGRVAPAKRITPPAYTPLGKDVQAWTIWPHDKPRPAAEPRVEPTSADALTPIVERLNVIEQRLNAIEQQRAETPSV